MLDSHIKFDDVAEGRKIIVKKGGELVQNNFVNCTGETGPLILEFLILSGVSTI